MAKGITQVQVNQAADSLLLVGERPTIERIRAVLGTGSPNTVNRLLDDWWTGLGERLTQSRHKVAMPEAPADVAALANQFWERALASAREQATAELTGHRQTLVDERTEFEATRTTIETEMHLAIQARDAALQKAEATSLRLADLQRVIDQQASQLNDLGIQRDRAVSDFSSAQSEITTNQNELKQRQAVWDSERSSLEATHMAMQDRWMGEVDRARQDEAKLAAKQKQLEHMSEVSARKAAEQISGLSKRLLLAEREEIKSTAKIASLQEEITRLHVQLNTQLLARPSKAATPAKKSTTRAK
jgi:hypothetical protein